MTRRMITVILLTALMIGGGAAAGGYLLGRGIVSAQTAVRSVVVKGLAEKEVLADLATWSIRFTATGDALDGVQSTVDKDSAAIRAFLIAAGFRKEEISLARLEVTDLLAQAYRRERIDKERYIVAQTIRIRSGDVARIKATSGRVGDLVKLGIVVSDGGGPLYFFTGLNFVKPEMIAKATRNARVAAARFAKDSGSRVGAIRRARQGVFQILPRDRGNGPENRSIEKTVRIVATVNYELER